MVEFRRSTAMTRTAASAQPKADSEAPGQFERHQGDSLIPCLPTATPSEKRSLGRQAMAVPAESPKAVILNAIDRCNGGIVIAAGNRSNRLSKRDVLSPQRLFA